MKAVYITGDLVCFSKTATEYRKALSVVSNYEATLWVNEPARIPPEIESRAVRIVRFPRLLDLPRLVRERPSEFELTPDVRLFSGFDIPVLFVASRLKRQTGCPWTVFCWDPPCMTRRDKSFWARLAVDFVFRHLVRQCDHLVLNIHPGLLREMGFSQKELDDRVRRGWLELQMQDAFVDMTPETLPPIQDGDAEYDVGVLCDWMVKKGGPLVVSALRELPGVTCLWVGTKPKEDVACPQIVFAGGMRQEEAFARLRRCRVLLVPYLPVRSLKWNYVLKIFEYLRLGRIVLASDNSGNMAVAEKFPGRIVSFRSGDATDLARHLRRLCGHGDGMASEIIMPKPVYLYVTPFFPSPTSWRGAFSLDFVKALMRTGRYDVRVFVPGAGADYEIDGVRVFRFPTRRPPSNVFPLLFAERNRRQFLGTVSRAGINLSDVAVCHANTANFGIYPLAVKKQNPACQTLLHHHDLASFGLNPGRLHRCWLHNVVQYPIFRRLHEAIDLHVFISEASRKNFLRVPRTDGTTYADYRAQYRGLGFYRSPRIRRSLVLHNGVDTSIFNASGRVGRATRKGDAAFVIGCVGNIQDLKSQDVLIRAMGRVCRSGADLPRIRVVFVGSGEREALCRRLADEEQSASGGRVVFEFRREVTHEKLPDFYRSLDLFVLPSRFEGFGCVYTEAYACGVPFICCRGQGISELTPDEWMIDSGDVAGLSEKIAWVIRARPEMRLTGEWRIDPLVRRFVDKINSSGMAVLV